MEYTLRRAKTAGEAKAAMDGMFKSRFPLTPELQNCSLGTLFLTVHQLAAGTDEQKTEQAMNFIRRLEDAELGLQGPRRRTTRRSTEAEAAPAQALEIDQGAASPGSPRAGAAAASSMR